MKPDANDVGDDDGQWVWAASGAAISDYEGKVRDILLLGTSIDDLTIRRMGPLLDSKKRTMDLFMPSDVCQDGEQLTAQVEEAMTRWEAENPGKTSAKNRQKHPKPR